MPLTDQKAIILVKPAMYGNEKTVIAMSDPDGALLRYYEHEALNVVRTAKEVRTLHREAIEDGWNGASVRIDPAGGLGWATLDAVTDGEFGLQDVKVESLSIQRPASPEDLFLKALARIEPQPMSWDLMTKAKERLERAALSAAEMRAEEDKARAYWSGSQWGEPAAALEALEPSFRLLINVTLPQGVSREQVVMAPLIAEMLSRHAEALELGLTGHTLRGVQEAELSGGVKARLTWDAVPQEPPPLVVKKDAFTPEQIEELKNQMVGGKIEVHRHQVGALGFVRSAEPVNFKWAEPGDPNSWAPKDEVGFGKREEAAPVNPAPAPATKPAVRVVLGAPDDVRLGSARFEPPKD